jgi:hypothetical protein
VLRLCQAYAVLCCTGLYRGLSNIISERRSMASCPPRSQLLPMQHCPSELVEQIFSHALQDVEAEHHTRACMTFGGICRSIRHHTLHVRWRSIAVVGRKQMLALAALVTATPGAIWPVENMYLADTSHLQWFDQDEWAPPSSLHRLGQKFKIKAVRVSLEAKADAAVIGALTVILAAVSSSLRRLSLCMLAFPRCIFQPAPLSRLESLTCFLAHGFPRPLYHPAYNILLAAPILNRLHIIPYSVHSMELFFSHLEEIVLPTLAVIKLSVVSPVHLTNERANVVLMRAFASLVETSLHIVILPDQHDCCCCQVHDIYEGVQTAGITVSTVKSQIKSKPAARVTVRDPGSVLSCADRTRKTHSDPLKQVVWDNWVYRLDGKTWIERMADDNLQEWRLGASGILDEPYVGDREELF